VTQPRMDDNDKARFLEATMPEEERARAVAHLSVSDEDAEDVGDAAYLLRELEAEDGVPVGNAIEDADVVDPVVASNVPAGVDAAGGDPKVIPLRPPSTQRARRRVPAQWLALAAVLAGVLLVLPPTLSRSGREVPGEYAALLANPEAGLGAGWIDNRPWSSTRSGGRDDGLTEDARAARLGALHVDLEVSLAARQAEQAERLSAQIVRYLGNVTNGGLVAAYYQEIGGRSSEPLSEHANALKEGWESLALFLPGDHLHAGAWAEAAYLAAARRDTAFFTATRSREALNQLTESPEISTRGKAAAEQILDATRESGDPDWPLLSTAAADLLAALGS
jgi:hypothetical protein